VKSPFDILGVEARFDLDLAALEKRFRDLSRDVHPDRSRRAELGASIDLNAAYRTLKDDLARGRALLEARGVAVGGEERENDPESEDTIVSVKRFMGRGADDPETRRLGTYGSRPARGQSVRFAVAGRGVVTPVEVSAEILRELKDRAEDELGPSAAR
jgi:curved DNA-binding protein CbpA